MALLLMDGLDRYTSIADITTGGWSLPNGTGFLIYSTSGSGRGENGGYLGGTDDNQRLARAINLPFNNTYCFGFAVYLTGGFALLSRIMSVNSVAGTLFGFHVGPDGTLYTDDQNFGAYTSNPAAPKMVMGSWHWIEIQVNFGTNNSDGSWSVYMDGVLNHTAAARDTFDGTNIANITFRGVTTAWYVDDPIVWDLTGTTTNTFPLGERFISTRAANADGSVADWTGVGAGAANFDKVDDPPSSPDGDTTHISSNTLNQENRVTFAAIAGTPVTIEAVQLCTLASTDAAGVVSIQNTLNSGGSQGLGTVNAGLTATYTFNTTLFDTDPNGNIAWTKPALDAIEGGVKIV